MFSSLYGRILSLNFSRIFWCKSDDFHLIRTETEIFAFKVTLFEVISGFYSPRWSGENICSLEKED
jgi:hypothetical protein